MSSDQIRWHFLRVYESVLCVFSPWTWPSPPWPRTPAQSGWSASPQLAGSQQDLIRSEGSLRTPHRAPGTHSAWPGSRGSGEAGASGCVRLCLCSGTDAENFFHIPPRRWATRTPSCPRRFREKQLAVAVSACFYHLTRFCPWAPEQAQRVKPCSWAVWPCPSTLK